MLRIITLLSVAQPMQALTRTLPLPLIPVRTLGTIANTHASAHPWYRS